LPSPNPEILDRVYARADRLWWRRQAWFAGAAAAVAVLLVATSVLAWPRSDGRDTELNAVDRADETTTTVVLETTTTTVASETTTTTMQAPPAVTPPTTRPATASPTTTTALVCRNSHDPRCGPFYWDPAPGPNEPSTTTITYAPASPRVGETVTFTVRWSDPDGPYGSLTTEYSWGDGRQATQHADVAGDGRCREFYGPWTPPKREPHSSTWDAPGYTYEQPGTYTFSVSSGVDKGGCYEPGNPYRSPTSGSATVTVSA
jgi:cytoskeletal protein RodZ